MNKTQWVVVLVTALMCVGAVAFKAGLFDTGRAATGDVQVSAAVGGKCMGHSDAPVELTINNRSRRPTKSVRVHIAVHERGDSADLATLAQEPWTEIVEAGEARTFCSGLPLRQPAARPHDPVVFATLEGVTLYAEGEMIPR